MDGDVRIWEGIDDDDAKSHRVGDRAYAIAFRVWYTWLCMNYNPLNSIMGWNSEIFLTGIL